MNSKIGKAKALLGIATVFFLTAGVLVGSIVTQTRQNIKKYAASDTKLSISPSSQNVTPSDDVSFSVVMDTGESNVTGLDLVLNFDTNVLHVDSLTLGPGISNFDNIVTNSFDNSAGKIVFTAFTLNKGLSVNGSSIQILKVNAKVSETASSGNHYLTFDSTSAVSATNETHSVLTDTLPGTLTVTVVSQPTPSPKVTEAPTQGTPNYCGGTCGSDNNCQSGYTCYQGFCRNPSCTYDVSCECKAATPTPTKKPNLNKTAAPYVEPVITTAPVVEALITPVPTTNNFWQTVFSNASPVPMADQEATSIDLPESKNTNIVPWIIGSMVLVGLILVFIAVGIAKNDGIHKSKPPVIRI